MIDHLCCHLDKRLGEMQEGEVGEVWNVTRRLNWLYTQQRHSNLPQLNYISIKQTWQYSFQVVMTLIYFKLLFFIVNYVALSVLQSSFKNGIFSISILFTICNFTFLSVHLFIYVFISNYPHMDKIILLLHLVLPSSSSSSSSYYVISHVLVHYYLPTYLPTITPFY